MTLDLGVAIIGAGGMGHRHAHAVAATDGVWLAAAADPAADRLQPLADLGCPSLSTDWRAAISNPQVDAVIIATPPLMHFDVLSACIAAGKHALLEKPITVSLPVAHEMVALCRASDCVTLVGFHERHNAALKQLRDAIFSGALGEILMICVTGSLRRDGFGKSWLFDSSAGGGVLIESAVHNFDLVRWLAGDEFSYLFASGHVGVRAERTYEDTFALVGRLHRGTVVQINGSFSGRPDAGMDSRIEIMGTKGGASYDVTHQPIRLGSVHGMSYQGSPVTGARAIDLIHKSPGDGAYCAQIRHFSDCIRGEADVAASIDDGRQALALAHAAIESMRSGRRVDVRHSTSA